MRSKVQRHGYGMPAGSTTKEVEHMFVMSRCRWYATPTGCGSAPECGLYRKWKHSYDCNHSLHSPVPANWCQHPPTAENQLAMWFWFCYYTIMNIEEYEREITRAYLRGDNEEAHRLEKEYYNKYPSRAVGDIPYEDDESAP